MKAPIDLEKLKRLLKREQEFSRKWMVDSAGGVQQEIYALVPDIIELLEQAKVLISEAASLRENHYHYSAGPEVDWLNRFKKEGEK